MRAIDAIAALEKENAGLRHVVATAARPIDDDELDALAAENERLLASVPAENEEAFLARVLDDRDDLLRRRDALRERAAGCAERLARSEDRTEPSAPRPLLLARIAGRTIDLAPLVALLLFVGAGLFGFVLGALGATERRRH